jgi:hypothetical protein
MEVEMNKRIKIIITAIIAFAIVGWCSTVNAASATLSASSTSVNVGDKATVTVNINAATWNVKVSGAVTESVVGYDEDGNNKSTTKTFTVDTSKAGTYTVSLSGDVTDASGANTDVSGSKTITVKAAETPKKDENTGNTPQNTTEEPKVTPSQTKEEQTKSGEYHLKSLSTSVGTLKPSFNTYNQDYTLEFPADYDMSSLKSIDVSAAATDSKAKVSGTGSFEVKEGDNEIIVNCTAENGKVLAYRIKFKKEVKAQQSDLRLKTFSITKLRSEDNKQVLAKLNEEFKPDVFEYTMDVDEDTKELNIDYEIDEKFKDKITVEITGNKDLKPGENIITIKLTSKDDEKITTTYTIKVKKAGEVAEEKPVENKSSGFNIKLIIIIVGSIVGLLVLILIILLIVNHIQKKKAKESMKADDDNNFVGGDNGFDADIGHDVRPVGVVEPDDEDSNYDFLSRDDELSDEVDDDDEKRFGGAGYNTLHQNYDPDDDEAGFDDTDLPEGTVSEHMINAKLNGEADELKKRYEVDELQEEIADELKDAKTKRKGRGRRFK